MAQTEMNAGRLMLHLHAYVSALALEWNKDASRYGGATWDVKPAPGDEAAFVLIRKRKGQPDDGFLVAAAAITQMVPPVVPAPKP